MNTSAINEYIYLLRNVRNAAQCLTEWALNNGDADPDKINWGDVGVAGHALDELKELCAFLNIELKEV